MALQECGLNTDRGLKELIPHGTTEFPCAGYSSVYTDQPGNSIPWHWHEEIEVIYISDGALKLKVPSKTIIMKKGELAAINSNIPHYGIAEGHCHLQSLVFHTSLISGTKESAIAKKYLNPLTSCRIFSCYYTKAAENHDLVCHFLNAFHALAEDIPGFEFVVRENLSRICYHLYTCFEADMDRKNTEPSQDDQRIKKMLEYIHQNYSDNISLPDIANAANIGERECLRCFQKTIQLSPIQYLLKYRIMRGAEMLLKHPSDSVSEIASACGFNSPSNFSQTFKHFYNCSPRNYRNQENGQA